MPLYEYECETCGVTERLHPWTVGAIACPTCGGPAPRVISVPVIRGEITPYDDDGLGVRIETRQQRAALMKAEGLVEKGTTERHGAKGTIFSHPGRATDSVPPNGAYGPRRG